MGFAFNWDKAIKTRQNILKEIFPGNIFASTSLQAFIVIIMVSSGIRNKNKFLK